MSLRSLAVIGHRTGQAMTGCHAASGALLCRLEALQLQSDNHHRLWQDLNQKLKAVTAKHELKVIVPSSLTNLEPPLAPARGVPCSACGSPTASELHFAVHCVPFIKDV